MKSLIDLSNIGKILADKLNMIGIKNQQKLKQIGSKNAIIKSATIENNGACINIIYALEAAIQGFSGTNFTKIENKNLMSFI